MTFRDLTSGAAGTWVRGSGALQRVRVLAVRGLVRRLSLGDHTIAGLYQRTEAGNTECEQIIRAGGPGRARA